MMNRVPCLLMLLCFPLLLPKAGATIIVSTGSDLQGCSYFSNGVVHNVCPPPPKSTFNGGLIVNGDFGDGNFTGFSGTLTQNKDASQGGVTGNANIGYSYAYLASGGSEQTLSQTFATTVGDTYTISFLLGNFNNYVDPSQITGSLIYDLAAVFGDQTLVSLDNSTFGIDEDGTLFTYTAVADSTSTSLQFSARNDPGAFSLTNISVFDTTAAAATPEPSSLLMLGTGLLGVVGAARRRLR